MPRLSIVAYLIFIFPLFVGAQVYHYETGKVLGVNEPNKIIWKGGTFNNYPAEYGTLIVKENRSVRNSRLINIPVIRVKSINQSDSLSPVFLLHGGPGESNLQNKLFFDDLVKKRDIVLVGYRGVDGSVCLDCPDMKHALLSDSLYIENYNFLFSKAAESCIEEFRRNKIDIGSYNIHEVITDIEVTRNLLKYDSISFLAFSYGTILSQLYAHKYDSIVSKMALIGARPANRLYFEQKVLEKQIHDIYLNFTKDTLTLDSNQLIEKLCVVFDAILTENKYFNKYRLLFFSFAKLYTIQEINDLYALFNEAFNGNAEPLYQSYSDFYRNFPGEIVLGDIFVKKQGFIIPESDNKDKLGLANILNSFYSPEHKTKKQLINECYYVKDSIKTLYIVGDSDVASLPSYFKEQNIHNKNVKSVIFKNTGHMDFFYTKKKMLSNELILFFNN